MCRLPGAPQVLVGLQGQVLVQLPQQAGPVQHLLTCEYTTFLVICHIFLPPAAVYLQLEILETCRKPGMPKHQIYLLYIKKMERPRNPENISTLIRSMRKTRYNSKTGNDWKT
jgi:hypothetical protein